MHPDRKTRITREEAVKALQGFINRHFNQNRDNWSRASIPAHPEDNDILLSDYITQREAEVAALEQQLAAKDAEIAAAQAALREILWESQRLCQIYGINHSGYRGWLRDRIAALAETPAAPEVK